MKLWLKRFDPRSWSEIPKDQVVRHPLFGLRGRLLVVLFGLFVLSSVTLVVEMVLYGDIVVFQRTSQNNIFIFVASLGIAVGVFTYAWWTRYLSYWMLAITLSNLVLYGDIWAEGFAIESGRSQFFWIMLLLLLLRDLPLCLYLTASRRARLTLEHQVFRLDPGGSSEKT